MPRITLYGMMQYDPTLFDGIVLPSSLDASILKAEIVSRCGDLYPYYQVPPILKLNISYWFLRRRYDFLQMQTALTAQYNPIENYDRHEEFNRDYTNSGSDTNSSAEKTASTSTTKASSTAEGSSETNGINTEKVSAYNADNFQNRGQTDTASASSQNDTATSEQSITDAIAADNVSTILYGSKRNEKEAGRVHGNIGVTTAQQMITAEMEMRTRFDIYKMIAELFEREFITQIY